MLKKVALFDFDNTVASGDSIVRLLRYDIHKNPLHFFKFIKVGIVYIMYLLHFTTFEKAKTTLLFPLHYMNNEELQKFYKEHVEIYYYPHVVDELKRLSQEGYLIILCTASCEAYMQYCDLPIDKIIGTRTQIIDNQPTSVVVGKNCKHSEKVNRIIEYLREEGVEIDYENSFGFSDSNDDIPMLSLVNHKKRILLKTGEIIDFKE